MSASGTCVRIPGFLCLFPETLAVAFALSRDVVAEHGAEHEILLGREPVERFVDECRYGIEAAAVAEIEVHLAARHLLNEVADTLMFEPFGEQDNSLLDVLVNPDSPNADRGLINESLSTEVDRALETLTERERDIIKYFFGIGCSTRSCNRPDAFSSAPTNPRDTTSRTRSSAPTAGS